MSNQFRLSGYRSASGQKYLNVETDQGSATMRLEQFSLANPRLPADLAAAGLPLFTKKQLEELVSEVPYVTHFEENRVAERPGWNGKLFVLQDGTVIGSDAPPLMMFTPKPGRNRKRGTLANWQTDVVMAVKSQPLVAIAIMSPFLAPVLHLMPQVGNVTIEFTGPSGTGKSIAQLLAASVMGPGSSITCLRDVLRDLEAARRESRDHTLIVDHVHPVAMSTAKTKKAELFVTTAFDLVKGPGGRVTLLSGRYPLADACDMEPESNILTLQVNGDGLGVFSTLPRGIENGATFAAQLASAARKNYGQAFPAFMTRLQKEVTESPAKVRSGLQRDYDAFLRLAGEAANGGADRQSVSIFAAIYAAGRLARQYRCLPLSFPCKRLTLAALDHYRRTRSTQASFVDRLEALISGGQIVTLSPETDPALLAQAVDDAIGTVAVRATGRIVRITPESIVKAFPDWPRIKNSPEVRAVLKVDGKNLAVWGKLAPSKERIRLFQFELPIVQHESLFGEPQTASAASE